MSLIQYLLLTLNFQIIHQNRQLLTTTLTDRLMKKFFLLLSAVVCSVTASAQSSKQNLDADWQFSQDNQQTWQKVDLPHDWSIQQAPHANATTGNDGGYYDGGYGIYKKSLYFIKSPDSFKNYQLHFDGVYQHCEVYVNDSLAGTHGYGYTPFYVDINNFLHKGKNKIEVRVDNVQQPSCRWYSGSGIYRHVWLETFVDGAIDDPRKLFVTTEKIYGISADGMKADSAIVKIAYEGQPVERRTYSNINLWSPSQPALYDIKVGALTVKHGFRSFSYNASEGFKLNGVPMLINGACVHHDNGVIGAMSFDAAEIRKVQLMKKAGFNLIRTSHNPQAQAFYDACDSIGMMVIDESFDGWYSEKKPYDYHTIIDSCYVEDITAMVLRDRNHPSIICWSIGNEVIERKDIRVIHTAQKFKNVITSLDNTRPITEALCAWDDDWDIYDPHAAVLDIVGYNYMMHKAESDHERCPERVMWQTESYPRDAFANWKHTVERPYIIGDMVWTGLDYLGESGIGYFHYEGEHREEHWQADHFPYHGAYCGDVDMIGWRKPISHYRNMLWNTKEGDADIYLSVKEPDYYYKGHVTETMWSVWPTWESWNWKGWEGKDIEAEIYTKAPRVRLYLNDKLIAEKDVNIDTHYKATIKLPYQAGTLKAVSLDKNGNVLAESILRTSGEPSGICLTTDRKQISADGLDLAYVKLEIVDKDGNLVPDAEIPVTVNVKGQGTLLATATANLRDLEPKTSSNVTTYKGQALIVVRSSKKAGKTTISAVSSKIKGTGSQTILVR